MTASLRTRALFSLAYLRKDEFDLLATRFGSPDGIAAQSAGQLEAAGLTPDKSGRIADPDETQLDVILRWAEEERHALLMVGDVNYPTLLADINDPPLVLFVKGSVDVLSLPSLAVVGSRNPTGGGSRNALAFAGHLGSLGFSIVSGLAEGIDAAAHDGALKAHANTVGVLGTGIDRVYPPRNRTLAHRVAEGGALVTEYPPGTPPKRHHFPERNRIITGLCLGTLVVEAAQQSGSLISARLAAEQGREVFAIPGSIHNPLARGCHQLIRQGAKLVETAEDIVSELGPLAAHLMTAETSIPKSESVADNPEHDSLLNVMGYDPISVDELRETSGLTIAELSSMLLILELEGKVEKQAGGRFLRSR